MQLRNPWGRQSWSGAWCARSPLWERYPEVAAALESCRRGDGIFWMSADDFLGVFDTIYACRFDENARRRQATRERIVVPHTLTLEQTDAAEAAAEVPAEVDGWREAVAGVVATCLGVYKLARGQLVNGKPAWRHAQSDDRWLAYSGSAWCVQKRASLGERHGLLLLPGSAYPDLSESVWQVSGHRSAIPLPFDWHPTAAIGGPSR